MHLSIIVPTLNERDAPRAIKALRHRFKDAEILVIDKSNDAYRRELIDTGVGVIAQWSKGYESALMQGFSLAKGDIISTIDPDGTYSVDDFARVVGAVEAGEADFCIGNRFGHLHRGAMTKSIAFGNKALSLLFRLLYRKELHDCLSGSFAMTREAFESIRDLDVFDAGTLFFEIELARRGYALEEIPISYRPRIGTKPKINAKHIRGVTMAKHTIRFARDYDPLLIFGLLGLAMVAAGGILGTSVLASYIHTGTLDQVGRALISLMLIILGVLAAVGGLILDLLLQIEKALIRRKS